MSTEHKGNKLAMSQADMAYANKRDQMIIAAALREAIEEAKARVTVQTRSEEHGKTRTLEVLSEIADDYEARAKKS